MASLALRILCLGVVGAALARAVPLRQSGTRVAPDATSVFGMKIPQAKDLDFTKKQAALVAVSVDPVSDAAAKAVRREGSVQLTLSVSEKDGSLSVHPAGAQAGHLPVAWARYNNTVKKTGWAYLSIQATSDPRVSNDLKMYAAGFLEGVASAQQIRDFQHNADALLYKGDDKHHSLANIQGVFDKELHTIGNLSNMFSHSGPTVLTSANVPKDPWWEQARYSLLQTWGILDSFNREVDGVKGKPMSMVDMMMLNSDGETPELEIAYDMEEFLLRQSEREGDNADNSTEFIQLGGLAHALRGHKKKEASRGASLIETASSHRARAPKGLRGSIAARRKQALKDLNEREWMRIRSQGHCSALIRLTKDNKDLMVGHTTFSDYSEMNRIFKYYDIPVGKDVVQKLGFSSYPGVAGSTDDYYLADSGLVVTETTISMLTDEPYDKLDDNGTTVPDFMRIMIATKLAKTGEDWVSLMKKSATGTYSSQWMVVDYNKFQPGKPLQNGTLFVLEQIPGISHSVDMSSRLQKQGYWASENRPWYMDVRDSVGMTEAEESHGNLFSADDNPRGTIFKATAPKVQTLADMRAELNRNKWPREPLPHAWNAASHAIAARGDLDKEHPDPNGGVDSKVTNFCLAKKLACDAISGPSHADQKPFSWVDSKGKELFPGVPHDGEPNVWNFGWQRMSPSGEIPRPEAAESDCSVL